MSKGQAILDRAVQCDQKGLMFEARFLYQQGMNTIMSLIDGERTDKKGNQLLIRIEDYQTRMREITKNINKIVSHSHPMGYIEIPANSRNCGFDQVFGKYMTDNVIEVIIEEPNLAESEHFSNLVMFLEVLNLKCKNLRFVEVVTCRDPRKLKEQDAKFEIINDDLKKYRKLFGYRYEPSLTEPRIIFSNGYIFRLSNHGLHYLKQPPLGQLIGSKNQRLRESKGAIINVFRTD